MKFMFKKISCNVGHVVLRSEHHERRPPTKSRSSSQPLGTEEWQMQLPPRDQLLSFNDSQGSSADAVWPLPEEDKKTLKQVATLSAIVVERGGWVSGCRHSEYLPYSMATYIYVVYIYMYIYIIIYYIIIYIIYIHIYIYYIMYIYTSYDHVY